MVASSPTFKNPEQETSSPKNEDIETAPNTTAQLRFEDLTIDDELCLLDRVVRYCRSGIALQRLVHVKMIPEAVTSINNLNTTTSVILPLCSSLVLDNESIIRQHLALQLLPLSKAIYSQDSEKGYSVIIDTIIRLYLNQLIDDKDYDVRKASSESLIGIGKTILNDKDKLVVCDIIVRLCESHRNDDIRVTGASLLGDLSSVCSSMTNGNDIIKERIIPILTKHLIKDSVFRVRRSACQSLPMALSCLSSDLSLITPFLSAFDTLSKDELFRVRRTCAECIVDLSRALNISFPGSDLNRSRLIPICTRLLSDENKIVRQGMMQFLGPFLVTFLPGNTVVFPHPSPLNPVNDNEKNENQLLQDLMSLRKGTPPNKADVHAIVSNNLLAYFCSMATIDTSEPIVNTELRVYCAYSLPAVLLLLGREHWLPSIQETFYTLVQSEIPGVRRCLASSFHAIAHILGPQLLTTHPNILNTYQNFLKHDDDITRMNALKHISSLLTIFPNGEKREFFLPLLNDILSTCFASNTYLLNWRLRDVLSCQFTSLIPLFPPDTVRYYIVPMIYTLSADPVSKVREHTYTAIPILFRTFKDNDTTNQILSHLKQMGTNTNDFSQRQGYCTLCTYLAQDKSLKAIVLQELLPIALNLQHDKVMNVRSTLYKSLLYMPEDVQQMKDVKYVMEVLKEEMETWDYFIMENKTPLLLARVKEELSSYKGEDDDSLASI